MVDKNEAAYLVESCMIDIKKTWGHSEKMIAETINKELQRAANMVRNMADEENENGK